MRALAIAVATALLVVTAVVGTMPAGAGGPTVVTVVEHAINDKVIDVGRPGDSAGDLLTFANPVFDEANETRVGRDQGSCIRISPKRGIWRCSWTTFLEGGSLTVEGPFYDDRESDLAITGGTGVFGAASGEMHLGFRDDPAEYDFVFSINP